MGGHAKGFLGWSIVLIAALIVVLFAHHATVRVTVASEPIQVRLPATLDTSISKSLPNLAVFAAKADALCVPDAPTIRIQNTVRCAASEDTKQFAETAIQAALSRELVLLDDSLTTSFEIDTTSDTDENRTAVILVASAKAVPIVSISKTDYYTRRKNESQLRAYFEGIPNVTAVEIRHFPSFFRFLPFRYENVTIILDIQYEYL
ncbi:MAG: hypothetical protein WC052_04945 [Patescibacteria group bacterium]|jgi:hypothetical protein